MNVTKGQISKIIKDVLGELNLYKIDRWKYPNKLCRHNNSIFCDKCRLEIESEKEKI